MAERTVPKILNSALIPESTLAVATIGVAQIRNPAKRRHKPTQFFGQRIGAIDSSNPTLVAPRLHLEQRKSGNALLFPAVFLPTDADTDLPDLTATGLSDLPVTKDIPPQETDQTDTNHVLNINQDAFAPDDSSQILSKQYLHYDSDVNIVLPSTSDDQDSVSSWSVNDYADSDIDGRAIATIPHNEQNVFYGVQSTEFEKCFDCMPAENGHMY